MLTKALNLSFAKHLTFKRCFGSQIIKTETDLTKYEQKVVNNELKSEVNDKSLTQLERQVMAKVVRSPVQMDSYWETTLREKKYKRKYAFRGADGGVNVDFVAMLHHKYDFSLQGLKRWLKYWVIFREDYNQRYITKRHAILGPELATAHFVSFRGGRVRFKHAPEDWVLDCEQMPNKYDPRYRVIAVDASDINLRYDSLDNFTLLDSLQELNLSKNKYLDDFMCDKIARLFRNSKHLSILDLSDNPLVTNRGIETLHRIKSLKKLIISGTKAAKYPFIDLLVILFNDVNPNCEVIVKKDNKI